MLAPPLEPLYTPAAQIVRRRLLPVPGEVLRCEGEVVSPGDVVARTELPRPPHVLDVARALDVSVRAVERCLRVREGQEVEQGTLLASRRYLWGKRELRAPVAGRVSPLGDGHLLLRPRPEPYPLRAYLPGEIIEVYPQRGVAVRTVGAVVRGVWGCGPESSGPLAVVGGPGDPLTWEQVGLRHRGAILLGGHLRDERVLWRARQFGLAGLVLGSVAPELCAGCRRSGLAVVITEGVGRLAMAEPLHGLLRSHHGRLMVLSGGTPGPAGQPEVLVPLDGESPVALVPRRPLQTGAVVRLTRAPHLGAVGMVAAMPNHPRMVGGGGRSEGVEVRLADGRIVFVPHANLEVLDWGRAAADSRDGGL